MSDVDRPKLKLYEDDGTEIVDIWKNFINHRYNEGFIFGDNVQLLAQQYNARYGYAYTELIFESEADKLDFLLTWS